MLGFPDDGRRAWIIRRRGAVGRITLFPTSRKVGGKGPYKRLEMGPRDRSGLGGWGELPLVSLLAAGLGVPAGCSVFRRQDAANEAIGGWSGRAVADEGWVDEETSPPSGWRGLSPAPAESQSGS